MNKEELYDACQGKVSKTSFKEYSGSMVISGKYGMIENLGDLTSPCWDIWVTGVHLGKELSTNRINLLASALKPHVKRLDLTYNRELTCVCTDENKIGDLALLIGARKKMKMSPERLAKLQNTGFKKAPN